MPIVLKAVALPAASLFLVFWSAALSSNGTVWPRKNISRAMIVGQKASRWVRALLSTGITAVRSVTVRTYQLKNG